MKLSEFSVRQPVAAIMLFCALGLIGAYAAFQLNFDMYPDIEPPVVSIITVWPGASASDVESEVTEKIEDYVNGVSDLETLTSKSLDNLSVVACRFAWGTDLDVASNDIRDKLEMAKRLLPEGAEKPVPFKFSSATAPVLYMTVTADKNQQRLFHYVDKVIGDSLKRVSGVGGIIMYGGMRRRFNVYFDRAKLEAYHLSVLQVNRVLKAENRNIPAGNIKSGTQDYFVRIPARFKTVRDMEQVVVGVFKGRPVHLREVARVSDSFEPMIQKGWGDGKSGMVVMLQKQAGRNTVEVLKNVKARLESLKKELPPDIRINITTDNSHSIMNSLRNLRTSLLWGIVLIVVVNIVFLRRMRTVVIIALIIPASLIIAFIAIFACGYTINLVTLMALAIASGMVVDNGIVVLENIVRHLEQGQGVIKAAIEGAGEMGLAITASTLTTVVIFVPLMFLTGLPGIIFRPLGFVLSVTLLASLLVSLMLTPVLMSKWASGSETAPAGTWGRLYQISEKGFVALENGYQRLLQWALDHGRTTVVLAAVIFVSGLTLVPFLTTSFLPKVDHGDVRVRFRLPEGARIEQTDAMVELILKKIYQVVKPEEILHTQAYDGEDKEGYGVALGFDQGPNIGYVGVKLVDRDKRSRSSAEIAEALRREVKKIPGLASIEVSVESITAAALSGGARPVSLEIQGSDLEQIIAYGRRIKAQMEKIPGLVDVVISQRPPRPELWVEIDRTKAARLGLNTAMIGATLRNYYYGYEATSMRDAGNSYDIFTRLKGSDKDRLDALAQAPLVSADGRVVPLSAVARIVRGSGPIEIQRKNRQRLVKVEADLYGISLGQAKAGIERLLKADPPPLGTTVQFGGDIEEQKKAFRDMTILLFMGIGLVYMLMASLFGNLKDPLIVMFSVPFAFTGVLYAFYLTGTSLGIMSFMGVIMLMGIVVNNAIVLLDYTHLLRKRGAGLYQAVIRAGRSRLRPVLMTTMTTFFGMLPMAVSKAVGAEAWNPLGITMLGGLSVSTLVSLVLVPTIYFMLERKNNPGG